MSLLVRRHDYHFLSLRLVRNPSGFSERFPTSGNDIYVALLIAVLVKRKENRRKGRWKKRKITRNHILQKI